MSEANFAALLDRQADEIEKPKPMPMGTFTFLVKDHEFGESSQKKTPFIQFNVNPRVAQDDVDEEALAAVENWQDRNMRVTFYLTDDAMWRLTDFLEHCGIDMSGRTLAECIPETTNQMFNGYVIQQASQKNPDEMFSSIDSTAPAE